MNLHMMGRKRLSSRTPGEMGLNGPSPKEHEQKVKLSGYAEKIREE